MLDDALASWVEFRREHVKSDPTDWKHLTRLWPEHGVAAQIYLDNAPIRFALECGLLSGATTAEISEQTGILDGAVFFYLDTFYRIRDGYETPDWIYNFVLGRNLTNGQLSGLGFGQAVKYLSYLGGPKTLAILQKSIARESDVGKLDDLDLDNRQQRAIGKARILVGVLMTNVDEFPLYHELFRKIRRLEPGYMTSIMLRHYFTPPADEQYTNEMILANADTVKRLLDNVVVSHEPIVWSLTASS